ncbi:hypothetical protein [Laspinema olomoucense]|uniref:Uncharacterized protein n=1 Tax=Laspinema olomoucense D3b TaxID=2953688 RepID=A0ABT2NDN9_9CYAN|nr:MULTISPECIES: hypothetical protein [unclassified Laspinema]MCT7974632.1 hypothetical protein [Laspinema sp. D3d]MCT7980802.1 hypothetical protein [Laspinema sp. D3b]MCT7989268.1 hypothetical protein [Laspinema sp. D3a]MCT7992643.1 hypothetical protein [Laspinema sp. D3c]
MNTQSLIPPCNLSELFFQIYWSGRLTQEHRQSLRATLLKDSLSEEEQSSINRLIYAVRRGWLKLAD